MKFCPNCQNKYPDDANFCPREACASGDGPSRLLPVEQEEAPARFTPISKLGGARSGEVWHARDNQTGEEIAYKIVTPAVLPTPAVLERAQRELKQLQRSQSPRIARVIDCGKTADGRLFVATELCVGESLAALVARTGALPLERAKKIIAQIGEALLEGQKVGVVHHDLAPKNVLVDAQDQIKIINFSVALPTSDRVFGVPEFVSPEQAEGRPADQRSNTYSLGAIAVFLLSGSPPFTGPSVESVLEQVQRGELTPPSQRVAELTSDIDRILLRAMDKNSSRRPLTLRQFLGEVAAMHLGGAAAPGPMTKPLAFNKTIAYSGGAPEVRRLVAEATAARAEANGSGGVVAFSPVLAAAPPAAAVGLVPPVDPAATPPPPAVSQPTHAAAVMQPTPAPATQRGHGAAVAATMVAMPATSAAALGVPIPGGRAAPAPAAVDPHTQPTPPPVAVARPAEEPMARKQPVAAPAVAVGPVVAASPAAGAAPSGQAAQGANFRETLWFKKGDVEQMVADAKAKAAGIINKAPVEHGSDEHGSGGHGSGGHELPAEDGKPLEDRYLDDGTVTVDDRKKFSLRSGGTSAAMPAVGAEIPGDRMSESEMLKEIGGGKRVKVIAIAAVAVAVVVAVLFFTLHGKSGEKPTPPTRAAAVTKPAEPAVMPPPAAKVGETPTPGATVGDQPETPRVKEAASTKEAAPATARAHAAKKKPAKRTQGKKKR
jgi:Protein kinase domain